MCAQVCVPYVHACTHAAHIQDVCMQYTHTHAHTAHTPMHTYRRTCTKFMLLCLREQENIKIQFFFKKMS